MKCEFCEQPMGRTEEVQAGKSTMIMERRKLTLLRFLKKLSINYGPLCMNYIRTWPKEIEKSFLLPK